MSDISELYQIISIVFNLSRTVYILDKLRLLLVMGQVNRVIDIVIISRKPDSLESWSGSRSAKHEYDPSATRANPASWS